jgi:hypothetical protein
MVVTNRKETPPPPPPRQTEEVRLVLERPDGMDNDKFGRSSQNVIFLLGTKFEFFGPICIFLAKYVKLFGRHI